MTCREKLKREHPECVDDRFLGGCEGCPSVYGYLSDPQNCYNYTRNESHCTECWNREAPGMLTLNEYQQLALRTEAGMLKEYPRIFNGLMGLNGEAGECI